LRRGRRGPAVRAVCLVARARAATAGDAGDSPRGAGVEGRQRGQGRHRPATRLTTAGGEGDSSCSVGKSGNGRRRGRFALRRGQGRQRPATRTVCLAATTEAVRVYTQVPARLTPQRWRWTAATPMARRTWLTPLRVTDPMSIGPPTRGCMSASALRLVLRARWPDRGGRWDPGHC